MLHSLTFVTSISHAFAQPMLMVVPSVDGRPFTELILEFETAQGWKPTGGYDGLLPKAHSYGQIEGHLMGWGSREWNGGKTELLVCNCGVISCWPLLGKIECDWGSCDDEDQSAEFRDSTMIWSDFSQPHRRERDYSSFGPFIFDRDAYVDALKEVDKLLAAEAAASA